MMAMATTTPLRRSSTDAAAKAKTMRRAISPILAMALAACSPANAFVPDSSPAFHRRYAGAASTSTVTLAVIKGEAFDSEPFDVNEGGVGLAKESAIKIIGSVRKDAGAEANDLLRYTDVTEFNLDDAPAKPAMEAAGNTLICTGTGKELYKDPGASTSVEKEITLAPLDAVRDALSTVPAASLSNADSVVFNFCGGDDLILFEVLDAAKDLITGLDVGKNTKVTFNSLCHKSFPLGMCTVTVVATGAGSKGEGLTGIEKCVARGEVYFSQGRWLAVVEEDITTAKS